MTFAFLDGWWMDAGTFELPLRATNLVAETRGVTIDKLINVQRRGVS